MKPRALTPRRPPRYINHGGFAPECWPTLERVLNELLWLCPAWCRALVIKQKESDESHVAQVKTDYEYREATLSITPEFFTRTLDDQRIIIAHELIHVAINPLASFVERTLPLLTKDPAARKMIEAELRIGEESAVEDLSRAICGVLADRPSPRAKRKRGSR